jgi:hypothetical protein
VTRSGREGLLLALMSATVTALVDGVLLQLQRGYFTGGFLATDSATSWPDRLVFVVGSLALDGVLAGAGVLTALLLAAYLRWGAVARRILALSLGAGPLVVASLLEYQVFARLGDAFDIGLMFDLVGRRPAEFVAVSWTELVGPMAALTVLAGAFGFLLRGLNRWWPANVARVSPWRGGLVWLACALLLTTVSTVLRVRSDVQDNGLRRKPAGQALGAVVTFVTDVDRDGYGLLSRPGDPAPFDARVYPYALDVPGNGVDEDGIAGDLPVDASSAVPVARGAAPTFSRTPPVILVMLETFRADLLGQTEGGIAVTPVLNSLAAEGAAAHAYSHNGYTVQSRYHLFTGALAGGGQGTLLDDFRRNGYETAYFSAQDESFGGSVFDVGAASADVFYDARRDIARRYTTFTTAGSLGVSASIVLERVGAYLKQRDTGRPLFLYVNFYDTHFPYHHDQMEQLVSDAHVSQGDITIARAADVRRMYRNAAANVDKAVGALRATVRAHAGRDPVIVVIADHGESLFEEGFLGHGYVLNDVQTRIPLVAAGLALDLCEPVGQADLRRAIVMALVSPDSEGRPAFRSCDRHTVFQYLGALSRPRQIALTGIARRVVYDLRENRVQVDGGRWVEVGELGESGRAEWLSLVHHWERLRLTGVSAGTEGQ